MPDQLVLDEMRRPERLPGLRAGDFSEGESPAPVSEPKKIYLLGIRSDPGTDQPKNFARIVYRVFNLSAESSPLPIESFPDIEDQLEFERLDARATKITPEQVVEYFATGGRKSIVTFWRKLKSKQIPDEALQAFAQAFNEMFGAEQNQLAMRAIESHDVPVESFILRAHRLDAMGHTDIALDMIYDSVDTLLRDGEFSHLDSLLSSIHVDDLSVDMLLGLLTATLPARSHLPSRSRLLNEIERSLRDRDEYDEGLLVGLDG